MALRLAIFLSASAALLLGFVMPATAGSYPPGFSEQVIVRGLTRPMDVAWAPDGRMFVIQKDGRVLVVRPGFNQALQVANYSGIVNGQLDRGLLGIAVDSDYEANHFVYLLFTYDIDPLPAPDESTGPMVSQLLRIEVTPANTVVPGSETVLLGSYVSDSCPAPANDVDCIPSDGRTHSIGTVRADPDGTLWVGSGDGYSENSVFPQRTYDEQSMAGKILHISRDGQGLPGHPFCPTNDNLDDVCTKVHARGFRNPFRFTLRPGGGLAVGDVGWTQREELDLVDAQGGGNYGWPCREGAIATPDYLDECLPLTVPAPVVAPVYDYQHVNSNSIVGGPTYTGSGYPAAYRNSIFFGDFTGGFINRLVPNGAGGFTARPFASGWGGVALEKAPNGDLVSVNPVNFQQNGAGTVTRLVYRPPPPPAPPAAPVPAPIPSPASPADRRGPRLRLLSVKPRRGLISGTAKDGSGVRKVLVSVRRRLRRGGCSWWLRGRQRMSAAKLRCDRPRWMKGKLRRVEGGVRFTVRLHAKLPAGTFRVLARATDRKDNVSRLPRSGASLVRVRKR